MSDEKKLPWKNVPVNSDPEAIEAAFNEVTDKKCRVKFQDSDGKDVGVMIGIDEYKGMLSELGIATKDI